MPPELLDFAGLIHDVVVVRLGRQEARLLDADVWARHPAERSTSLEEFYEATGPGQPK